jgi:hypothetical protein
VSTMCSTSDSPVTQKCIEEPLHVRRLAELKRQVEEMSNQ